MPIFAIGIPVRHLREGHAVLQFRRGIFHLRAGGDLVLPSVQVFHDMGCLEERRAEKAVQVGAMEGFDSASVGRRAAAVVSPPRPLEAKVVFDEFTRFVFNASHCRDGLPNNAGTLARSSMGLRSAAAICSTSTTWMAANSAAEWRRFGPLGGIGDTLPLRMIPDARLLAARPVLGNPLTVDEVRDVLLDHIGWRGDALSGCTAARQARKPLAPRASAASPVRANAAGSGVPVSPAWLRSTCAKRTSGICGLALAFPWPGACGGQPPCRSYAGSAAPDAWPSSQASRASANRIERAAFRISSGALAMVVKESA